MVPFLSPNQVQMRKKEFQKAFQKRVPPKTHTSDYYQAGRPLETGPRVRIFNNKNNSSDNNSSNYGNNCRNYCSSSRFVRNWCLIWCFKSFPDLDFKNDSSVLHLSSSYFVRRGCLIRCLKSLFDLDVKKCSNCLLYTSPSPRDGLLSRMPSSA